MADDRKTIVPIETSTSEDGPHFDQLEAKGACFILHDSETGQSLEVNIERDDLIRALISAASPNSLFRLFKDREEGQRFRERLTELLS